MMLLILFDISLTFVSLISMVGFLDSVLKLSCLMEKKHEI